MGSPKHVCVIGHDDISVERTESFRHKRLQMIADHRGDLILPRKTTSIALHNPNAHTTGCAFLIVSVPRFDSFSNK